jgi:uncharacterized damage-inducible protein DinB
MKDTNHYTPEEKEYALYYKSYIEIIGDQNVIEMLEEQLEEIPAIIESIPEEKENFRYAEGKWSVKELLVHILDTERIMAYRALCIARGEQKPLPGFDENMYALNSDADSRNLEDIIEEFELLRMSNLALFNSFSPEMLKRMGNGNGKDISVRALLHIIAGHTKHHLNVLQERYLS